MPLDSVKDKETQRVNGVSESKTSCLRSVSSLLLDVMIPFLVRHRVLGCHLCDCSAAAAYAMPCFLYGIQVKGQAKQANRAASSSIFETSFTTVFFRHLVPTVTGESCWGSDVNGASDDSR